MDWSDTEELAVVVLGLPEYSDSDDIEQALYDRFECSFDQFQRIAESLIPFTVPAISAISGIEFQGFVNDGAFIVKEEVCRDADCKTYG